MFNLKNNGILCLIITSTREAAMDEKWIKKEPRAGGRKIDSAMNIYRKNIEKLRTDLRMSQKELGECLGLVQQTISGYEMGNMSPSMAVAINMCKLAKEYGFDYKVKDLMDISDIVQALNASEFLI